MPSLVLLAHVLLTLTVDIVWATGFWMDWPKRIYRKTRDFRWLWSWMVTLRIAQTEENCVKSIRYFCGIQIVFATISAIVKVALYK